MPRVGRPSLASLKEYPTAYTVSFVPSGSAGARSQVCWTAAAALNVARQLIEKGDHVSVRDNRSTLMVTLADLRNLAEGVTVPQPVTTVPRRRRT